MVAITPDLLTYVKSIDNQHEELINLINSIEAMGARAHTKEETKKALDFLDDYIVTHFGHEEELMIQYDYPDYNWHYTWHRSYILKVKELRCEFDENGASEQFTNLFHEFIIRWIVTHIQNVDTTLGKYINDHRHRHTYHHKPVTKRV